MKIIKFSILIIISLILTNCANNSENLLRLINMDKTIDGSVNYTNAVNNDLVNIFEMNCATLKASGAAQREIDLAVECLTTAVQINEISKEINNTLVDKNYSLFNALLENELTECEISWNNYIDAIEKLDFTDPNDIEKIISEMGSVKDLMREGDCMELYKNVSEKMNALIKAQRLFEISSLKLAPYKKSTDRNGFGSLSLHTNSISFLEKLTTKTNSFDDYEKFGPEGISLEELIHKYRDDLCSLIVELSSEPKGREGRTVNYTFDANLIEQPELLSTEEEIEEFRHELDSSLDAMAIDFRDKEALALIYMDLTKPKKISSGNAWNTYYTNSSLIEAKVFFNTLTLQIQQAQSTALQIIGSRTNVEAFAFNKMEALAFSSTSYINQGDSLDLKIMIVAFDSTEAMNLEYYVDDTSHTGDPLTFSGNPGDALKLSGGVGSHYVEGTIEVKEKGAVKKKPWKFNYSVGPPRRADL